MEKLHLFIPSHWVEALGWTLLHSLWQFALITLVFWALTALMKDAPSALKFNLGMLGLGLMVISFGITLTYELNQVSKQVSIAASSKGFAFPVAADEKEQYILSYLNQTFDAYLPALVNVWLLGCIFFLLRLAGDLALLNRFKNVTVSRFPLPLQAIINRVRVQFSLKDRQRVGMVEDLAGPITFGLFKPLILFPSALVVQMDPRQLEAILAHEFAHVKRMDFGTHLMQSVLEVFFFYHPAFWWINRQIKEYREEAADDLVLKNGIPAEDLAKGLAFVANFSDQHTPALALAANGNNFPLLNRIKKILGYPIAHNSSPFTPSIMLMMLVTLVVISLGAFTMDQKESPWLATSLNQQVETPIKEFEQRSRMILATAKAADSQARLSMQTEPLGRQIIHLLDENAQDFLEMNPAPKQVLMMKVRKDSLPPGKLEFSPPPVPDIDLSFLDGISSDLVVGRHFGDSLGKAISKLVIVHMDSSPDSEKMRMKMEAKLEALHEKLAISHERMAEKQKELAEKMETWQKEMEPKWQEYATKMEEWKLENEPKIKEYEEKMKAWAEEFAKKMEERLDP